MPDSSLAVTGSTLGNSVTTLSNCRLAKTVGLRKTKVIKNSTSSDPASLRRQVVSFLSRDGQTGTKRGEFKVSGYPYTYIDAAAAKVSRSTNTITFASAAFADNNSGTTNDPRPFGVLAGDVICEMDATATTMTRFAYISSVTATTVVYGGSATDTTEADGTYAGTALDASKPMRIYVPLRAGHVIRAVNSLVQVDKDHLVTELTYDEGNGVTVTALSTIGQNDSTATFRPNILKAVNSNATKYGTEPAEAVANFSDAPVSWKLQGKLTSSDEDTVAWAHSAGGAFSLTGSNGTVYSIAAGSANLSGSASNEYVLYFAPETDDDAFAVQAAEDYIEDKSRLEIATMKVEAGLEATFSPEQNISIVGGGDAGIKALPAEILSPSGRVMSGDGTQGAPTFSFTSDPNSGMYQYGDDQVAISVAGTARFITTASGIYATTTTTTGTDVIVTAEGLFAKKSSSIQYKDNVETLDFDSSKLDSLRPVSYNYKSDNAPDIGLIAEEVNEVYPELINYNKEGKPESVKYDGLSVMLLEEVTKLRQEVNELKEKN